MVSQNQVPIMTQSDSLLQFGSNSYQKPATALVVLRETVLGRELFDKAFRDYATRWRFKGPTPYDFFRTMEESSGVDLDWFWRGWFYSTDHVDIALDRVVAGKLDPLDADASAKLRAERDAAEPPSLTESRNTGGYLADRDPKVRDYYDTIGRQDATAAQRKKAKSADEELTPEERAARNQTDTFYRFRFKNVGGVVMPVILKLDFTDGSTETIRIPAEIWRRNSQEVNWQYVSPKTLKRAEVDPLWETADANRDNNIYEGAGIARTLKVSGPERDEGDKLKDNDLRVTTDGLTPVPATKAPEEKK
jgi:aminopeptidase N